MRNLLAALSLLLAVTANAQNWQRLEGQHSGVKHGMAVAVQDAGKWREIWSQHDASAPLPEVDFSRESVVVVFLGQTQTAGVKVQVVVQRDPIDANRLNVFYREVPGRAGFAAQVVCQPYAIVKVPRAAVIDVEKDAVMRAPEPAKAPAVKRDTRKMKALIEGLENAPSFD